MQLTKWMPWNRERRVPVRYETDPMTTLHHRIHQLFDDALQGFGAGWADGNGWPLGSPGFPRVDLAETEEEYRVEAELPGLEEKDVEVSLNRSVLTIRGEKRSEHEEQQGAYRCAERFFGAFHRTFDLPGDVDASEVEATFEKGVLTVRLPKSAESREHVHQIPVKAG